MQLNSILETLNFFEVDEINLIVQNTKTYEANQNQKTKKIDLTFLFQKPLPYALVQKIYLYNQSSTIVFIDFKNDFLIEKDDLYEYLLAFLKRNNNRLLITSLSKKTFLIDYDKILLKYYSNEEKSQWTLIENDLLDFLNSQCRLNFLKISYELDEVYINEMEQKQKNYLLKSKEVLESQEFKKQIQAPKTYQKQGSYYSKNQSISKLADLIVEQKYATVQVKVEHIGVQNLKNGSNLYSVLVSDETSAIYLKVFSRAGNETSIVNGLKEGQLIKAKIELEISQHNFRHQLIGRLREWSEIDAIKKQDLSEKKRIEFCVHTKMSAFDGLITPDKLYETLKVYGHQYFGITDRYNVQMYPEIVKYFENTDIKPMYGVEIEVLPEQVAAVLNPIKVNLKTANYVVFDLETTGLYPEFNDIIEFGATKYENGMLKDRIQFFIKPNYEMSIITQELTGISYDDIKDAIDQKRALEKIVNYVKDDILVAHNGINFDISFLNFKLVEYGFQPLKNPLVDTMVISRAINYYNSHTLEKIAHKSKIQYNQVSAHRADYDASVLAKVWERMLSQLFERKIYDLDEINDALDQKAIKNLTRGFFVNLYAKNQSGIKALYELISIAHTKQYFSRPTLTKNIINQFRENLLVSNTAIESEILDYALSKPAYELLDLIKYYDFILVAPVNGFFHEIKLKHLTSKQMESILKKIINNALSIKKPIIATANVYYLNEEDKMYHDVFVNIPILNRKRHRFWKAKTGPINYFRTTQEMKEEFLFLDDDKLIDDIVVNNGYKIVDQINFNLTPLQKKLFPPDIEGVNEKVESTVYLNATKMYGKKLPKIVDDRIKKELNSIIGNGYAVVYWISHLLVSKSIEDGYVVGSRGSVGSSIVATFLNITDVNPLAPHYLCRNCGYSDFAIENVVDDGYDLVDKECPNCKKIMTGEGHNIPFETFLGFNGDKVPDIDLNFSGLYQNKAHDFIKKMFGDNHAFRAGTISTIAEKTSFANVREYFETINEEPTDAQVHRYALYCQDVKRTTGQHPGGIVVVPNNMSIFDFTPYNFPADDTSLDWKTTHFAFEYIHDNLLKFDILGHDNPTALKMLKDLTGVDEKDVPNNDPKTLSLFNSLHALGIRSDEILGETTGAISIPEFGTKFVREMLVDAQPQSFADLIRISGLSHGTDVWLGNAKNLIKEQNLSLKDVIGCRDDIMVYLINKGVDASVSFKVMEDVRKGKGIKKEYADILSKHSVPSWYLESANKIKYMFPKAHATAYVLHAWKFAWYKLYYPLEYYCSYFSVRNSNFDVKAMTSSISELRNIILGIQKRLNNTKTKGEVSNKEKDLLPLFEVVLEMMARGYRIKMIDMEKSLAVDFVIDREDKSIICPFSTLDGLGEIVAESIVEARKQKPFISVEDLLKRTKITKQNVEKLKELNVLKGLSDTDQMSLFDL